MRQDFPQGMSQLDQLLRVSKIHTGQKHHKKSSTRVAQKISNGQAQKNSMDSKRRTEYNKRVKEYWAGKLSTFPNKPL